MKLGDFKMAWRLLIKEPGYSAVILGGLAVGFAACFLLLGYVRFSFSYDSAVPEHDRIVMSKMKPNVGKADWIEGTPLPFLEVGKNSGMVAASSLFEPVFKSMKVGTQWHKSVKLYAVSADFSSMFGLKPLAGDLQVALSRPDMLALTQSQARVMFGDEGSAVVGKTLEISGKTFLVGALLLDPPLNSTIVYEALAGVNTAAWDENLRKEEFTEWGSTEGGRLYFKLKPGATASALAQHLQTASKNSPLMSQLPPEVIKELAGQPLFDFELVKLNDLYFDDHGSLIHGDLKTVCALIAVAVLILLLAVANYVNLATVRTLGRQREIAMRKLMGATVWRLTLQFFAESVLVALIAAVAGLLLAELALPVFASLMVSPLLDLFTMSNWLATIGIGSLVGIAAGVYPAWVAQRVRPQLTLSGRGTSETIGAVSLRRTLTTLQFSTAMALVGVSLAIGWQTYFATNVNPGFDPKPLLVLNLPLDHPVETAGMREALARIPGVTGVTGALFMVPGQAYRNPEAFTRGDGKIHSIIRAQVNANFFDVHGLAARAGRLFDSNTDGGESANVVVLNELAAHEFGFANAQAAVGELVTVGSGERARSMRIIGIAPDIRYESLHELPKPMVYIPHLKADKVTVRTSGDIRDLERAVDNLQRQYFPSVVINVRRMESIYAANYVEDLRLAKLLAFASLIAIAIAAFGIYVLSAYSVQRLTKQIVLRKLFGATRIAIAKLVSREFLGIIAIAAVLGLPLAAWAIQRYLASYIEHAPIGLWTLLAAVFVALLVTVISTARHTHIAMTMSPMKALND